MAAPRKQPNRSGTKKGRGKSPQALKKILRIGIIHSGRIVEERLIPSGQSVTVGTAPKCTFDLNAPMTGRRFELFQADKASRYSLNFTDEMRGKVSTGSQVVTLAALVKGGQARRRGKQASLPLKEANRGKVTVGEYTVLFQFVAPPPQPARPRNPDFRAWRWEDADVVYLAILLLSAILHTAAVIWIESQPPPKKMRLEDFPDRFVKMLIPPEPEDVPADTTAEGEGEEVAVEEPAEAAPPADEEPSEAAGAGADEEPAEAAPETAEQKRARLEEAASSKGMLALIGTAGDSGSGDVVADLLSDSSSLAGDVGKALAESNGVVVGRRDSDQSGLRGGGGGDEAAGIGDLGGAQTGGGGGTVEKAKAAPVPKMTEGAVELSSGDAQSIRKVMRRYQGRVKACYERELKGNPDLAGKVALAFLITAEGGVEDVDVVTNTTGNKKLGSCIKREIGRIKFPAGDDDVEIDGYPFLFSSQ